MNLIWDRIEGEAVVFKHALNSNKIRVTIYYIYNINALNISSVYSIYVCTSTSESSVVPSPLAPKSSTFTIAFTEVTFTIIPF